MRRKWQPTPVFLPGKSHGWRSLMCYSSWGHKESDTTERLHSLTHIYMYVPIMMLYSSDKENKFSIILFHLNSASMLNLGAFLTDK